MSSATVTLDEERMEEPGSLGPGLLEALWRYRVGVAIATLSAALLGFAISSLQMPEYAATARLLLADPEGRQIFEQTDIRDPTRYVRNRAEFLSSRPVLTAAGASLDPPLSAEQVEDMVDVRPSLDLDLLEVVATSPSATRAADIASAVAEAYQQLERANTLQNAEAATAELRQTLDQIRGQIEALNGQLTLGSGDEALGAQRDALLGEQFTLQSRIQQLNTDAALVGSGVELYEEAKVPEAPVSPKPLRDGLLAAVLGFMGAGALAWFLAERTQSADRRQDAARVLQAPLLGEVPDFEVVGQTGSTPAIDAPTSPAGEAYQFLVGSVEHALAQAGGSTVLLTSAKPGDGKTVTALNLAVAMARDGRRVVLVDADERARGLSRRMDRLDAPGMVDLASDDVEVDDCILTVPIGEGTRLRLLPAGKALEDPAAFFRTPGFRKATAKFKNAGEILLVDSPPLLAVADTSAIAAQADGIVLVVDRGTQLSLLADVRERLAFVGTPLLGYVFNRARPSRRGAYGYGYGYGSYGSSGQQQEATPDRGLGKLLRRRRG